MSGKKQDNIQVYRKKWHFNIGVVIFGVILVYLLVTVLTYVTAKRVSSYEVREGSIYRDNAYTGLAIRQETVVNADAEGYINYFVPEGSKVGKHTNVYSLSPEKLELTGTGQEEGQEEAAQELSSEEKEMVLQQTRSFSSNFQDANFSDTYAFKDSVENILASSSSQSRQSQLAALLQSQAAGVSAYTSAEDGIVAYSVDGYEGVALEQITPEILSKIRKSAGAAADLVPIIVDYTVRILQEQRHSDVYLTGQMKLLGQPEYRDVEKAQEVLSTLDEEVIANLPAPTDGPVQILVGPENIAKELKDTSVVMTRFDIGDGMQGMIGVVGPTRMDYAQVTARLSYFAEGLGRMFGKNELPPAKESDGGTE